MASARLIVLNKGLRWLMQVDLSKHVRTVVAGWRRKTPPAIELKLSLDDELPPVDGDDAQVHDMVACLIASIAGATGSGVVSIATGTQTIEEIHAADLLSTEPLEPGRFVYLDVRERDARRRVDLAPLSRMMGAFRGAIRVDPTDGAAVRVLWPIALRERADDACAGNTVLVVDDDDGIREMLTDVLEHSGYAVLTARSGEDGVASFTAHADDISVVLLDMTMPGMSGEETFRCIRKIRPNARVVVSTGHSAEAARLRFRAAGVDAFLQKPYHPDALFACLDRARSARAG